MVLRMLVVPATPTVREMVPVRLAAMAIFVPSSKPVTMVTPTPAERAMRIAQRPVRVPRAVMEIPAPS